MKVGLVLAFLESDHLTDEVFEADGHRVIDGLRQVLELRTAERRGGCAAKGEVF